MSKLNHIYIWPNIHVHTLRHAHTKANQPNSRDSHEETKLSYIYKTGLFHGVYRAYSQPTLTVSPYLGVSILQLGSSIRSSHCWYFPCPPLIRSVTFSHGFYSLCLKTSLYYRCRHNAFVEPQRRKAALYIRPTSILYINQTFSIFSHNFLTHVCVCMCVFQILFLTLFDIFFHFIPGQT